MPPFRRLSAPWRNKKTRGEPGPREKSPTWTRKRVKNPFETFVRVHTLHRGRNGGEGEKKRVPLGGLLQQRKGPRGTGQPARHARTMNVTFCNAGLSRAPFRAPVTCKNAETCITLKALLSGSAGKPSNFRDSFHEEAALFVNIVFPPIGSSRSA